jgi:hypothetical protein
MVALRRVIALPTDAEQRQRLLEISRSRTEPTNRVERARIILAYLQKRSAPDFSRPARARAEQVGPTISLHRHQSHHRACRRNRFETVDATASRRVPFGYRGHSMRRLFCERRLAGGFVSLSGAATLDGQLSGP